jgi:hypothetical protein
VSAVIHPVVCITDSLGFAVAKDPPPGEPRLSYFDLAAGLLRARGLQCEFIVASETGRTSEMLENAIASGALAHLLARPPLCVVLQVGVVDCAPRVLGPRARMLVSRLRPRLLRRAVVSLLKQLHHPWFFKAFGHRVLVDGDRFGLHIGAAIRRLREAGCGAVLVASILPTTSVKEKVFGGMSSNIARYNDTLRAVCSREGARFVDFYGRLFEIREELTYDGVHPTIAGKREMAAILSEHIASVAVRVDVAHASACSGALQCAVRLEP